MRAEGVFQVRLRTFVIALLVGRSLRYVAEGIFGMKYGRQTLVFLVSHRLALVIATIEVLVILYVASRVLFRDPAEID